MKDAHDPREFRRWLTFAPDGSVSAVHEFAGGVEQPLPGVIETAVIADFRTVKIDPALLADCDQKRLECAQAFGAATVAKAAVDAATQAIQQAVEDATRPKGKK